MTPLDYRLNEYHGYVWIRPRLEPLTPEQDRRLTEFAMMADNTALCPRTIRCSAYAVADRAAPCARISGQPTGDRPSLSLRGGSDRSVGLFRAHRRAGPRGPGRLSRKTSSTIARGTSISTGIRRSRVVGIAATLDAGWQHPRR